MPVDLHVHTTASDGTESPSQVVKRAKEMALEAIAITDHDTLDGIAPALEQGQKTSLEVIAGVELSTEYEGREIHVLGYLIDLEHHDFLLHLGRLRQNRAQRATKMVSKLQQMGIPVTLEQVLAVAGDGAIGRPHVARVLVDLGVVQSMSEAFDFYLGRGCPAYVPRLKYSPEEAVRLIRQAGGVTVLAHPGVSDCDELIPFLVAEGLQGLEVYYPGHTQQAVEHYFYLCEYYNLLFTGGSDYHGAGHEDHNLLGAATVPYSVVQQLKEVRAKI